MAITAEITGEGVFRITDPGKGIYDFQLPRSFTVTQFKPPELRNVANGVTDLALNFGGITAAKWLVIETDGAITLKVNGSATAVPVDTLYIEVSSGGLITAATISNASGASRAVRYAIGG